MACRALTKKKAAELRKILWPEGDCEHCSGEGEILQDDGSDSTGTLIPCEYCEGTGIDPDAVTSPKELPCPACTPKERG